MVTMNVVDKCIFRPIEENILLVTVVKEMKMVIIELIDDVINVSGHRIGTAEVEDAINTSDKVIESAVIGFPHPIKGPISSNSENKNYLEEIRTQVTKVIGPIAKPDRILLVDSLPKTRSKIMRRILRKIASGNSLKWEIQVLYLTLMLLNIFVMSIQKLIFLKNNHFMSFLHLFQYLKKLYPLTANLYLLLSLHNDDLEDVLYINITVFSNFF